MQRETALRDMTSLRKFRLSGVQYSLPLVLFLEPLPVTLTLKIPLDTGILLA